jgi:hypothetical protein
MKARTKKTRWLLLALLFGLLAAAGLTFTYRHGVPTLAEANDVAAPVHAAPQPPHAALIAANVGAPTVTPHTHRIVASSYVESETPDATPSHSDSPSNPAARSGTGWANDAADHAGDSIGAPQTRSHPAASGSNPGPQPGTGDFAYQPYEPLGCALPAGCGAVGGSGNGTHQTSGTSGGPPVQNSQGSNSGNDTPGVPTSNNNGSPQTNDSGQTPLGQGSEPPGNGSDPPAAAPELDPATLAGALTLLLGALAILRGRRPARATR